MNGAESLIRTLLANDVDRCFANPGTSEMHLVQAIDSVPGFNATLCLFEGVCTGAADGFGRMRGIPATTLLHLGPGLGNGIANLHNCRRAATPLINIVGDHAIHHVAYDAPLTSNVEAVAKPVSTWIRTSRSSEGVGIDAQDAFLAAMHPSPDSLGAIATLIVPADCAWGKGLPQPKVAAVPAINVVAAEVIESIARSMDDGTMLLVDGTGLSERGVIACGRIAKKTGCKVFSPTFPARVECGPQLPSIQRLPYFPEHILALMAEYKHVVLAGGARPVSFFAYKNTPSDLIPEHVVVDRLAHRHEDVVRALEDVADALDASTYEPSEGPRPRLPIGGELSVRNISAALGALMPDNAIVTIDSGGGGAAYPYVQSCVRHSWLNLTGGSIGQGGPAAVGAAIACPDRPVFALLGDGGAMYTMQYLWTAAREGLDLTTVIYANQQYNILEVEYLRMGVNDIGPQAARLFDLNSPTLDWVGLAQSQGVPGAKATSIEEFTSALQSALSEAGPFLIEALI